MFLFKASKRLDQSRLDVLEQLSTELSGATICCGDSHRIVADLIDCVHVTV